eukprot:COSAG01_NODE_11145_length_1997_cov_2.231823_1_plen_124_part_00
MPVVAVAARRRRRSQMLSRCTSRSRAPYTTQWLPTHSLLLTSWEVQYAMPPSRPSSRHAMMMRLARVDNIECHLQEAIVSNTPRPSGGDVLVSAAPRGAVSRRRARAHARACAARVPYELVRP